MHDWLTIALPILAIGLQLAVTAAAAVHAVLNKRDPRSAAGWAAISILVPVFGPILYALFGVNRIERRAAKLRRRRVPVDATGAVLSCPPDALGSLLGAGGAHLAALARVGDATLRRPLLHGNVVKPLVNGEEAYPAMLAAIDAAERSVAMASYLFVSDAAGDRFVDALARAARRGVAVRVLLDAVGIGLFSRAERALRAQGVPVERFLPVRVPWRTRFMNLRNHRKLLVVDGRTGFTGSMNIRQSHVVSEAGPRAEQDIHFRLEGPVVNHLMETFAEDWAFAAEETLTGEAWFPRLEPRGGTISRGVPIDPGEHFEKLLWTLHGALDCAVRSIRIMTPYFLPDPSLLRALSLAAMRGVEVDIVLPARPDVRLVRWASAALLWQVLEGGCRVWRTPAPFDHSKLMVVDGLWTLLGSANWDPRSLRLNFEFNVECYDPALAANAEAYIGEKRARARRVTQQEMDGRSLPVRFRDATARMFSPFL
jgi:cardiolipin synthase